MARGVVLRPGQSPEVFVVTHVLVLTCPGDVHADAVVERLVQRRAGFTVFDPGEFPVNAALSVSYSRCGPIVRTLSSSAGRLDLDAVDSIWFRRPNLPSPDPGSTIPFRENVSGTRPVRSPPTYGTVWIAWQYRERCGRSGMHRTSLLSWRLRVYSVWLFPRPSSPQIRRSSWTSGIAMEADHHETAR